MTTLPRGRGVEACVLRDLSEGGLHLRSSAPIPLNTAVRIDAEDLSLVGKVTRCDAAGGAYSVGIQLSPSLAVNPFRPVTTSD
jgi:PilZ domain-containing protein